MGSRYNHRWLDRNFERRNSDLNPNTVNPRHLDHAVRMGLISAGFIGISIGILYGLTHSAQIGAALTDAIDVYGDSSGVSFDTGSPMIASAGAVVGIVSLISYQMQTGLGSDT